MAGELRTTPADAAEQVAALPRRTAHVAHALLTTIREDGGPVKASEVVVYDAEALSVNSTASALQSARRHGLAEYWGEGIWTASLHASDLRDALEDRFLADTEPSDAKG